ncbi:MAG: oligosaccharide flippase family protein [Clostridia bacterium]|nr:oligosaccharide flippase family protein [Clostridia bacterium]
MDKKRSVLNIFVSVGFKIVLLVLALLSRRFLINYAGNDANGLYSLYTSIIGFLAIADLGVGTAINFSMYKPIVDGDRDKVAALYQLYRKIYWIIGSIILGAGLLLMPALPLLAKDYSADYNLYLTFFIMLCSVVVTYIFSAKTSLINAHKNNYITTTMSSIGQIARYGIQIVVLVLTGSFEFFLGAMIVAVVLEWIMTEIVTRKKYGEILSVPAIKVDADTKKEIVKNTKAIFMHKIGSVLVNTADSIIISAFIGVAILGKYSNYMVIMSAMTGVLALFFTPLTAVIGHLCAEKNAEEERKYFWFMYLLNFCLGVVFFLGYYAVIDNVVAICFNADLVMPKDVSLIITINYFIQFMRQAVGLFRDASGTFYYDRWKPVVEGIINVALSIAFVYWIGLVGVIVATIITNLLICHVVEPYVLYKHEFKRTPVRYYSINYSLMAVFGVCLAALHFSLQHIDGKWTELLVNGCIAVAIALVPIIIIACVSKTFRRNFKELVSDLAGFLKIKRKSKAVAAESIAPDEGDTKESASVNDNVGSDTEK